MMRGSGISAAASSSSFFCPNDRPRAGAPASRIRPVRLPAPTENEQRSTAVTPPKLRVTSRSSSRLTHAPARGAASAQPGRAASPFRLGPQHIFDPGELALRPEELELVLLPLQH